MRILTAALAITAIGALHGTVPAYGSNVFVQSGDNYAQGLTHSNGTVCYILTAAHSVGPGAETSVVSETGSVFEAELVHKSPLDLAILQVIARADDPTPCEKEESLDFAMLDDLSDVLRTAEFAMVNVVTERGALIQIPVDISLVGPDRFTVHPTATEANLQKGLSGSGIYVGQTLVGVLLRVTDGKGEALRLDYAKSTVAPFIRWSNPCVPPCEFRLKSLERVGSHELYWLRGEGVKEEVYRFPRGLPVMPYLHLTWELEKLSRLRKLKTLRSISLAYSEGPRSASTIIYESLGMGDDFSSSYPGAYKWNGEEMLFELVYADSEWVVRLTPCELLDEVLRWYAGLQCGASVPEPDAVDDLMEQRRELLRDLDDLMDEYSRNVADAGRYQARCDECLRVAGEDCDDAGCEDARMRSEEAEATARRIEDLRDQRRWLEEVIMQLMVTEASAPEDVGERLEHSKGGHHQLGTEGEERALGLDDPKADEPETGPLNL